MHSNTTLRPQHIHKLSTELFLKNLRKNTSWKISPKSTAQLQLLQLDILIYSSIIEQEHKIKFETNMMQMVKTMLREMAQSSNNVPGSDLIDPVINNTGLGTKKHLVDIVTTALNIFVTVVILTAVVYIILMGIKFVTSGGDTSKASEAQKGITFAIIGIIVALGASIIVNFVLQQIGYK